MILSICIPTTIDRAHFFTRIKSELNRQIKAEGLMEEIEILSVADNKEMTIGEKRNLLYAKCKGEYAWQIDDDDWIHPEGIRLIIGAAKEKKDCITFSEVVMWDGNKLESSNFSLKYNDWNNKQDGFDYVRTPFFKTPIKTEICKKVKIKDMRFGEDHAFAKDIKPLLKSETHINDFIYWYLHYNTPFKERYGIK